MSRVAVVSAGDSGIGLAVAKQLAAEHVHVYLGTRHPDRGERVATNLRHEGLMASVLEVDVAVSSSVESAFATLDHVDALVNAAGTHSYRAISEMTEDDLHYVLEPSLVGTFLMCQRAVPLMSDGGRIVNISSLSMTGGRRVAHYAAAKAAVVGFTRALATELVERGIGVNAVVPALMDTPMTQRSLTPEAVQAAIERNPRGRLLTPEEVAHTVVFLASERAAAITGQSIVVDGGTSLPR